MDDFKAMFNNKFPNVPFNPRYVMSDGALPIYNAAQAVFSTGGVAPFKHLMCDFHMRKACRKNMVGTPAEKMGMNYYPY